MEKRAEFKDISPKVRVGHLVQCDRHYTSFRYLVLWSVLLNLKIKHNLCPQSKEEGTDNAAVP